MNDRQTARFRLPVLKDGQDEWDALIAYLRKSSDRYAAPDTRNDCLVGSPNTGSLDERLTGKARCSALKCRNNLDRVDAQDVPGRRNNGRDPEWTMTERGDAMSPSCALDVAMRGAQRCSSLAELFGDARQKRRWQQEVRAAIFSYGEALRDAGIDEHEVRKVIEEMMAIQERERTEDRRTV